MIAGVSQEVHSARGDGDDRGARPSRQARSPGWPLAAGVALLALLLGGVYSFSALSSTAAWLHHTDDVRVKVALLRATLLDAETGTRGYLLTGRPEFLEPHDRALPLWRPQLDEVRALTSDNPAQQERLRRLEELIQSRMEALAAVRAAYDAGVRGDGLLPRMNEGRSAMDAARAELTDIERVEAVMDRERQREMTRRRGWTAALLITGAVAFLAYFTSVSRQRRAAEGQRERVEGERRFLQDVFAGIDDGITIQDPKGQLIFANAAAAHLIGFESVAALLAAPVDELLKRFEVFDERGAPFSVESLPSRTVLGGGPAGAPVLIKYRRRATGEERWSTLQAFPVRDGAGQVVRAVNVFRDVTARRQADERRAFLLRAADELSSSLDYEVTLAAVARLAVPVLADWCAVDVVESGLPKRVATAHVDPAKIALVAEIERRYPSDPEARTGAPEVLRTGEPQLIAHIPREMLAAAAVDDEHLRLIDALELRSYLCVPLTVGARVLGAISFAMAESGRVYVQDDLSFARGLAERAGLAIENARLYREAERGRREAEQQARFAETFVGMLGHDLRRTPSS
jgi:CHASE3 domain sensor protein